MLGCVPSPLTSCAQLCVPGAVRRPGERVDVLDEGGWWEGEVVAVLTGGPGRGPAGGPAGRVTVRMVDGEREVSLADVRGSAAWTPGEAWRPLGELRSNAEWLCWGCSVKPWHRRLYCLWPG